MNGIAVIEIESPAAVSSAVPVRQLVYLVLLLAVRDRATEVHLEPSATEEEWMLRYKMGDTWYSMVSVPLHVPISAEVRGLVKLSAPAQVGHIRLLVAGQAIDLKVTFEPTRPGEPPGTEKVVLSLPEAQVAKEDAARILREYLQGRRSLGVVR